MGNSDHTGSKSSPPLSVLLQDDDEFSCEALRKAPKCVKTGFPALDKLLGGGLAPGLTVLGASPGLGKSTLALNIAEYAAQHGTPVRYYSYEMPPKRLGMKLIARQNFCAGGRPLFSARDLFDAGQISAWDDKWAAYQAAREQVARRLDNLYIIDCDAGGQAYTAEDIQADCQRFMREQNPEKTMPLLIVDYLQILPLENTVRTSDVRQAVDHNVRKMTALSKSFGGVPVLLISSLSRTSYKIPVQIDSFKESGSIEFSADTLLGIQFSACQNRDGSANKDWNMNLEKDKSPREMDLVILKQRYGETGKVPFLYYAAYDCFVQPPVSSAPQPLSQAGQDPAPPGAEELQPASSPARSAPPAVAGLAGAAAGVPSQPPAPGPRLPLRPQNLEKAYINNTMIAHHLRSGSALPGKEHTCMVIPAKGIQTTFSISADLSIRDCDVADALYSLFLSEKYFSKTDGFSLHRLLTVLTGDPRQTLTAQKREALLASIGNLQQATISIQCREELDARNKNRKYQNTSFELPRSFLRLGRSGEKFYFPSVELMDVLPLYEYASMTGQMIAFPTKLLDVRLNGNRKGLNNTATAIAVKHFLIYRLEVVRNKQGAAQRDKMRTVSFSRGSQLFQILRMRREACSHTDWSRRCKRVSELTISTLEYFKRIGYIQDYSLREEASVTVTGPIADPWALAYEE